jgi:diacylglycerol kinase family enzyme
MKAARDSRSAALVVNAGARLGASAPDLASGILEQAGLPVAAVHRISSGAELPGILERVVDDGHDLVIVGGGDGTVSYAAGLLAGTGTVLGVLPLGTANDLARTLEIPANLGQACAALADGKVVDIDLGRANGHPLAYGVAAVRAYARHKPFRARLEFPDGDHETLDLENMLQVAVGNGRHYGGGNAVSPTAGIDDHTLDVYAIPGAPLREHMRIARLLKDGSFVERDGVYHLTTQRVRLVTDPPLPVNLDGEIATATPADFTIDRNAVHLVVPQGSTAASLDG